jgi:hypothetical protein
MSLKKSLHRIHAFYMTYYEQQSEGPNRRSCRYIEKGKVVA